MLPEKIRDDFPSIGKGIYLDSACMSLRPKSVIDAMLEYYRNYPACAGRSGHKFGRRVTEEMENVRKKIAKFFNARKPEEIVFTKNTTEGINMVASGLGLKKSDIVLTTDKEHNSNLIPWHMTGTEYRILISKPDNTFDLNKFQEIMSKKVKLVSIVQTSNLDGVTNPIKEITKISHDYNSLVLVDGAQSAPHKQIDLKKSDADFFACSGHKMLGPTGTGILYGKKDHLEKLKPLITGGETVIDSTYETHKFEALPQRLEPGLQNYAGIIGFGAAIDYLNKTGMKKIEKHETELNKILSAGLLNISKMKIIGPSAEHRGSICSFYLDSIDSHSIAMMLDNSFNIMIRSGRHCVHSWFNSHKLEGSARASLYLYNTKDEMEKTIEAMEKISTILK
ncbi:MAG: cysteine desulfurase [Candidatus Aenigmarchaeota archaeon]|nr:cysteine desulfurase [Candidatus Aenigmarchaeota archaeon]